MQDLLFSGVKPTSVAHLGNYIGALQPWAKLQHTYPCLFCVVDLHAITVLQDPKELRKHTLNLVATYLAIGIDPERCTLFIQSEIPEHTELGWILATISKMGELRRMTQFKDKAKSGEERAGLGLFGYPVLMAADILLYDTTIVPVGEDQMQHLEFARILAKRFNDRFGPTFTIPQGLFQKVGARIMSLADPTKKMSKSEVSKHGAIFLDDNVDTMRKKIIRAVTDSGSDIMYQPNTHPAISNLLAIYHHMTGQQMNDIESTFAGKGYAAFKKSLADVVVEHLSPIVNRLQHYQKDPGELQRILDHGREAACKLAQQKMQLVRDRVGIGRG